MYTKYVPIHIMYFTLVNLWNLFAAFNAMPVHPSAYARFHSTKMALIRFNGFFYDSRVVMVFTAAVYHGLFPTCRKEHTASLLMESHSGSSMSYVLCHKAQCLGRYCSYPIRPIGWN